MKILKERNMKKFGYIIRDVEYDNSEYGGEGVTVLKAAYNLNGDYIGPPKFAARICKRRGIKPELAKPDHTVCSIGYCENDNKWYGWSHRAIFGFTIGSVCEPGNCGYVPSNKEDFLEDCTRFWDSDDRLHIRSFETFSEEYNCYGITTEWEYSQNIRNKDLLGKVQSVFTPYPDEFGRGSWVAETMDDAKQMAIDFARSVS